MKTIWIPGIIVLTVLVYAFGAVAESNASSTSDNKTPWTGSMAERVVYHDINAGWE